jgi:hypothetical protein
MKLVNAFPKHFQLYLGDGISGVGPECNQYWGVTPEGYKGGYDGQNLRYTYYNSDNESIGDDFTACDKDECGYCGKCMY